ncbi:AMP-binding protein [Streptomyces sp. NBC_01420]|uniref:AMP-binding protein n=1 Tax=Streptomyces sp. NBC_01420 TaxID=2903858 RepID=UPI00324FB726
MTGPADPYWTHRRTPAHQEFRAARDTLLAHRDDHDAAYTAFRWPRPRHFNWALEWFDVIARGNDATALSVVRADGTASDRTFDALSRESDRTANWLRELGVRRGERVLLLLDARPELWEILLACLKTGAVVIPAYTSLSGPEIRERVERGRIRHVISEEHTAVAVPAVPGARVLVEGTAAGWLPLAERERMPDHFRPDGPTRADDIAFCYFTSGTTSAPKLVAHTHTSYPIGHLSSMYWNGLRPGDRHLNISAPGWAKHAWSGFFAPWNAEATIVALAPGAFDAAEFGVTADRLRVTSVCAPPSVWRLLMPHLARRRPGLLREATSAGEPLTAAEAAVVGAHWGVRLRDGYGQSEATAMVGTTPGLRGPDDRLGKALPGYVLTLMGEDGPTEHGPGELCVDLTAGPAGLMAGYLDDTGELRPAGGAGLYRTGDIAVRDGKGFVRILGREDDVFKSYDHRLSPYEIEAVLRRHPAVREAAVVPQPDPVGGAVPVAYLETLPGATAEAELGRELAEFCAGRLAPHSRPRAFSVVEALPRTTSGKVRRAVLAERARELPLAHGADPFGEASLVG